MLTPVTERTQETLLNHIRAFGKGDVEAIMADYAPHALLLTPEGKRQGKAEIRPLFEELVKDFPPGSSFEIVQQAVEEELAYIVWKGESDRLSIPFATDTLIIRDGKIVKQTFAAQMKPKKKE